MRKFAQTDLRRAEFRNRDGGGGELADEPLISANTFIEHGELEEVAAKRQRWPRQAERRRGSSTSGRRAYKVQCSIRFRITLTAPRRSAYASCPVQHGASLVVSSPSPFFPRLSLEQTREVKLHGTLTGHRAQRSQKASSPLHVRSLVRSADAGSTCGWVNPGHTKHDEIRRMHVRTYKVL